MIIFADTSALFAFIDIRSAAHERAVEAWHAAVAQDDSFLSTNYVIVEAVCLFQRRLGMRAAQDFQDSIAPALEVAWVDQEIHQEAMRLLLEQRRRDLSLVDCASFILMRRLGIRRAFALDQHFGERGFECLP